MRQNLVALESGPPLDMPIQGCRETQQRYTKLKTVSKLSRLAKLCLSYSYLVLMLAARLPEVSAQFSSCAAGWYLSGSNCEPYQGNYALGQLPAGYWAHRGSNWNTYCPAGKSTTLQFFVSLIIIIINALANCRIFLP